MTSIRNRLIVIIFSTLFACMTAISFITFHYIQEEFTEVMDGSLKQLAVSVSYNPSSENQQKIINKDRLEEEDEFLIQIWRSDELLYTSHPLIKVGFQSQAGFGNTSYQHGSLRYYQHSDGSDFIQVFQSFDERQDMVKDIKQRFITPILFASPAFLILIYIAIGQGLLPLTLLSKRVEERGSSNLSPINVKDVPEEIVLLVQALNQLLQRLDNSLSLQRRFTSDAAHELRTPLTAIKLQLDLLKRASGDEERQEIEEALHGAIERSTKLVESLLLLARHETDALSVGLEKVNLAAVSQKVVKDLESLALAKNQTLSFENLGQETNIDAQTDNIYVAIENLVQNAIHYTPDSGQIGCSISCNKKNVVLKVADNGSGIKPEERARVFDRFYRCQGIQRMGSGLGLSIVKNIVEYYQGEIELSEGIDGKGTSFTISFPKSSL